MILGSIGVRHQDIIDLLLDDEEVADFRLSNGETLLVLPPGTSLIYPIVGCVLRQMKMV